MYDEPQGLFGGGSHNAHPGSGLPLDGRPYLAQRGFDLTNGLSITFLP